MTKLITLTGLIGYTQLLGVLMILLRGPSIYAALLVIVSLIIEVVTVALVLFDLRVESD